MHASEIFRLPLLIQSTVCSRGPEPGSERLSPSMQYELSCKAAQQLRLRTRQANGWKTSHLIPRRDKILLHWVFQRLKVQIEDKHLPYPFLFGLCLCLCSGGNLCLHFFLAGNCENHLSEIHHCLFEKPSLPFLPFCPLDHQEQSFLTTIQDPVPVLHQRMLI